MTPNTLTRIRLEEFSESLVSKAQTKPTCELAIDCNRVLRAMDHGIGAIHGQHPHWYYDTAMQRICDAINASTRKV